MDNDQNTQLQEVDLPPSLKFLRTLVTVLTGIMIIGVVVVIGLLVTRLNQVNTVELPSSFVLPDGEKAIAFTQTPNWFAIVTQNDKIVIYNQQGEITQSIDVITEN